MKILKIKRCGDPDCPFFKDICKGDAELGLCNYEKRYIKKFDHCKPKDGNWLDSEIIYIAGSFPSWCPLEDV
jgi:hypothetical protein